MGIRQHLTYANVTATLALVFALGAGGAYAVDRIGTDDVRNNSLLSEDLRDGRAVAGRDVGKGELGRREIDEASLIGSRIIELAGEEDGFCDPLDAVPLECVGTPMRLARRGRIAAVATGAFFSPSGGSLDCEIRFDEDDAPVGVLPGASGGAHPDLEQTDGFSTTRVSESLPRGIYRTGLWCAQVGPSDARVGTSTITAIALTGR
jgi:hypothetical protein